MNTVSNAPVNVSPQAGKIATPAILVDVPALVSAYFTDLPDFSVAAQRVSFGTSGHRGSPFERTFNEAHVWVISQAVCDFRKRQGITGPLFLGIDTHALSLPALSSSLEVFAANGVHVMLAQNGEYTPTPAISHAILVYNRERNAGFADGVVLTPSHNPPDSGGFKYNTPNGGPASASVTDWVEARANGLLSSGLCGVRRMPYAKALRCSTTRRHDFLNTYVNDLGAVIDMDVIRGENIRMGVDPLGGAGIHYWPVIAERHGLDLTVVNDSVDPTFRFMAVDWDGQIRMDPSSPFAMQNLMAHKDCFDVAFACDADHDRHGIVTRNSGLLLSNHYLAVAIHYLLQNRPSWSAQAGVGKTVVSTQMIDRIVAKNGRRLYEVPAGFKWFVEGLFGATLVFAGEESAGASFLDRKGAVWTTDKDGIVPALLAAEITARTGRDPGEGYRDLVQEFGPCFGRRIDAPATSAQKRKLAQLSAQQVPAGELAGEETTRVQTRASGNDEPIGGVKVMSKQGWFAARPSGTENLYKIYAESFRDDQHLQRILDEAQSIVGAALAQP